MTDDLMYIREGDSIKAHTGQKIGSLVLIEI